MDAVDTAGGAVQRLLYAFSVRWTLAIGLLCAFLGIVYAEPLVVLLFGPSMLAAVDSVRILMAAILVLRSTCRSRNFCWQPGDKTAQPCWWRRRSSSIYSPTCCLAGRMAPKAQPGARHLDDALFDPRYLVHLPFC